MTADAKKKQTRAKLKISTPTDKFSTRQEMVEMALEAMDKFAPKMKARLGAQKINKKIEQAIFILEKTAKNALDYIGISATTKVAFHYNANDKEQPYFSLTLVVPNSPDRLLLEVTPWFLSDDRFIEENGENWYEWHFYSQAISVIVEEVITWEHLKQAYYQCRN